MLLLFFREMFTVHTQKERNEMKKDIDIALQHFDDLHDSNANFSLKDFQFNNQRPFDEL